MPQTWRLVDRRSGALLVNRVVLAHRFFTRLLGWQFRRLPADEGLLLIPCRAIHTCFMRGAIDVVFLGEGGRVLAVCRNLPPWRAAAGPRGTQGVLELPAREASCREGDALRLTPRPGAPPAPTPASAAFLL